MPRGNLVIALVFLMLPLVAVSSAVGGQGYVTQTTTTVLTNSQAVTVTEESVVTSNSSEVEPIFSSPLTLPPTHGVCGTYFVQPFNATLGSELTGNLNATSKVDFYVMTDAVYQDWTRKIVAGGNCSPSTVLLIQKGTTSYNFTLPIPGEGLYQIVVNNLSASSVNAHLTVNLSVSAMATVTMTMYSTSTQPNVQTLTLITLEPTAPQGGGNSTLTYGALILAIIIVIVVGARARYSKARNKQFSSTHASGTRLSVSRNLYG